MTQHLLDIDRTSNKEALNMKWSKLKNMVDDLHWKAINFLVKNYKTIVYPNYRVSQMVTGTKLPKITKRIMLMFSSHKFKQRLSWKCKAYDRNLVIVDESYTSCTCGNCGTINKIKGSEIFKCSRCKKVMDRDANGSRNILLKNIKISSDQAIS